ncbi:MAG: GNAT family N-acetyltransferase [Rhabdaerophilum sp.]
MRGTGAVRWQGEVRQARFDELSLLAEIERDAFFSLVAAEAFPPGDASVTPLELMEAALRDGLLFVAADEKDRAVGFLACGERDGALHIGEIDVWRSWQGKGVGRLLMLTALKEARRRMLWGAMLTTDRHAPFNRRFYETLGFREERKDQLPPSILTVLEAEISGGLDATRRLAMVLRFQDQSSDTLTRPGGAEKRMPKGWYRETP